MPWPVGYVCRYFLEKTKGRNKKTFLKEIFLNRGVGDIFGKNMWQAEMRSGWNAQEPKDVISSWAEKWNCSGYVVCIIQILSYLFYTFIQVLYFGNKGYDELAKLALNSCETTLNSARPRICKKLLKHNLKLTSEGILWNNPLELKRRSLHWSSLMLSEWVGPNWLRLKGRCTENRSLLHLLRWPKDYCIYRCVQNIEDERWQMKMKNTKKTRTVCTKNRRLLHLLMSPKN